MRRVRDGPAASVLVGAITILRIPAPVLASVARIPRHPHPSVPSSEHPSNHGATRPIGPVVSPRRDPVPSRPGKAERSVSCARDGGAGAGRDRVGPPPRTPGPRSRSGPRGRGRLCCRPDPPLPAPRSWSEFASKGSPMSSQWRGALAWRRSSGRNWAWAALRSATWPLWSSGISDSAPSPGLSARRSAASAHTVRT